ncbi:MAG TPA: rhomboid family intramembrane serine protease [Bacteroidia bacterium]|nr:rhomboid family intramembrane serine protease [Bacteroidia bacterium]
MAGWKRHLILLKELFPFTFVVVLWLIHLLQEFMGTSFADYSLYPRTLHGLAGIITAPLLHANFSHLIGNSVPLIVLGMLLFSNYKEIAGKLFWMVYLTNGIVLWLFARDAFHLGASGVVYGLAFFLFFSGFIRKIPRLTMLSFLIVFLYGSMVWGVFPFDPQVSWEAHLYGAISGLIFAYVLRRQGPQPINYWADEEEIESLESSLTEEEKMLLTPEQLAELEKKPETKPDVNSSEAIRINYEYKENDVQIKK